MTFDVVPDLLFRNPAARRAEISSGPEVSSPIPLSQMGEFLLQFARRPTFHPFHQIRWTQRRRARPEDVHVILADVPFLDPHIETEAGLTDQFPRSVGNLPL